MFARGFSPFTGLTKWTGLDMSGHGFTKFGAFFGAFVFTAPNVGNFLTASAIGNCETSVYVVLVSRMAVETEDCSQFICEIPLGGEHSDGLIREQVFKAKIAEIKKFQNTRKASPWR
jgi:hypothetical protein